jgi:hypothetical protein
MRNIVISEHAKEEIKRRKISQEQVNEVILKPQQEEDLGENLILYQSKFISSVGTPYILRVFIGTLTDPNKVVTVYKTTQIKKYWKESP